MKALLYKNNGTLEELPIKNIDTITNDSDGLCITLSHGRGDVFCRLLTMKQDWNDDDELTYQHCLTILHDYGYDNWFKERIKGEQL